MLKSEVVVGVAVDLDNRQMFFATDGQWDEEPTFQGEELRGRIWHRVVSAFPLEGVKGIPCCKKYVAFLE